MLSIAGGPASKMRKKVWFYKGARLFQVWLAQKKGS
jgi:hypothetical protein